jgi:hypothetical protein
MALRNLLTDRATTDDHGPVRQVAVDALGRGWPDQQTRALLTDRTITVDHGPVRQAAVHALARGWPDENTHTWLTDRAITDPNRFRPAGRDGGRALPPDSGHGVVD